MLGKCCTVIRQTIIISTTDIVLRRSSKHLAVWASLVVFVTLKMIVMMLFHPWLRALVSAETVCAWHLKKRCNIVFVTKEFIPKKTLSYVLLFKKNNLTDKTRLPVPYVVKMWRCDSAIILLLCGCCCHLQQRTKSYFQNWLANQTTVTPVHEV